MSKSYFGITVAFWISLKLLSCDDDILVDRTLMSTSIYEIFSFWQVVVIRNTSGRVNMNLFWYISYNQCNTLLIWCEYLVFCQVVILLTLAIFTYGSYYYHDHLHFHLLRTYAWAGYDEAQQLVGQRYALGKFQYMIG